MKERSRVYWNQLLELTISEWKLREQSSLTGFLWTLLDPLLTYAVLYWIFTQWMHSSVRGYAAYLIIGVVQYSFFQMATTYAMTSLLRRRDIMLNFVIPREILIFSSVASIALSYLLEFALMLGFLLVLGERPALSWTLLPAMIALHIALVSGASLILAVLAARFPDFERIWNIVITVGFFLTPVFYTLDSVDAGRRRLLRFNPMAQVIEMTRACALQSRSPDAAHWGLLLALCLILCAAGYALFKSQEKKLSDYVLC